VEKELPSPTTAGRLSGADDEQHLATLATKSGEKIGPGRLISACALIVLVLGIYGIRLETLTIRGEEPRRAAVGKEMLSTGEWVVPRLQGHPFLSRPPLQNWSIALFSKLTGDVDRLAMRLPSAIAVLLTVLVVFWYSRHFLRSPGAFAAGVAFATMAQVMELGRLGETEALFTFFVGASLLVWHLGYEKRWPAPVVWMVGYGLAALGALTKGPQAPFYFVGAVCLFLALRRDWRWLFGWPHLAGVLLFVALLGLWGIPFVMETGWHGVRSMLFAEVSLRFTDTSVLAVVTHLAAYPFLLLLCMLPWSVALVCLGHRASWRDAGDSSRPVAFVLISLIVAFPTCWIPPGAHERYMMPLYPLVAVLVGVALQFCYDSRAGTTLDRWHRALCVAISAVMAGAGLTILALSFWSTPDDRIWAQPKAFAVVYAVLAASAAGVVLWSRTDRGSARHHYGLLAVGVFMGLSMTGAFVNALKKQSVDTPGAIAELERNLPIDHRMVSLGPVNPLFGLLYSHSIGRIDRLDSVLLLEDGTFFCFDPGQPLPGDVLSLPFPWQEFAVVSVARRIDQLDEFVVVVGRYDRSRDVVP